MLAWLVCLALAPVAAEPPPVQRPKALEQPVAPTPSEPPPPVQPSEPPPPVVEPPPQPEAPPQPAPAPVVETPPQPAPAPVVEAPAPAPVIAESEPLAMPSAEPPPKPISPAFRRPGIWVAVGASSFAISTVMHFMVPLVVTRSEQGACDEYSCESSFPAGAVISLMVGSLPFDALAPIGFGFAGRSYGLRRARDPSRPRAGRAGFIAGGAALAAAGGILTLTAWISPVFDVERFNTFGWTVAGLRTAGIVLGSGGAFLLGYGIAQPRTPSLAWMRNVRPAIGREFVGLSLSGRM